MAPSGRRDLLLLLTRVRVEIAPDGQDRTQDRDEKHHLIERLESKCHLVTLSVKPLCEEKQLCHNNEPQYNTGPAGLSTDQAAYYGDKADPLGHVVKKLGGTLALSVGHVS